MFEPDWDKVTRPMVAFLYDHEVTDKRRDRGWNDLVAIDFFEKQKAFDPVTEGFCVKAMRLKHEMKRVVNYRGQILLHESRRD